LLRRRPLLALPLLAGAAQAQEGWPDRPLRFVVPFPPGSISDAVARLVADRLAAPLGQRVVVENRGGAGGNIGAAYVAREPADGYTFLIASSGTHGANPALYRQPGYDAVKDFTPVIGLIRVPNILVVRNSLPVRSVAEFIARARAHPGELTHGSIGNGSSQHLAGAQFEQVTGARLTHVPYRAVPPLLLDMQSDRLDASFQLVPNIIETVKAGQVRALAVTVNQRVPALPEVPTMAEQGVEGYETAGWFGLLAPAGTPQPIIEKLAGAMKAALADPEVRARIAADGAEVQSMTPAEYAADIDREEREWGKVVKESGAKAD
jgi:tripartite-type tricarboxylate transporter receptor subunit TctC